MNRVFYRRVFTISDDKELKAPLHNEAWLIRFLRPAKYYPESAYKMVRTRHFYYYYVFQFMFFDSGFQIKQYYQFKVKHANIYKDLTPKSTKNIFDHDILHVLPKRDQGGRRILVIELGSEFNIRRL